MINFVLTADESWRAKNAQKLIAVKFCEKLYTKETTPKAVTSEFLRKIHNKKKIFNKKLNLCAEKMSLDEIKKSLKQIIDLQVKMHLQQNFIKTFLMN